MVIISRFQSVMQNTEYTITHFIPNRLKYTISASSGFRDLAKGRLMSIVLCLNIIQIIMSGAPNENIVQNH